MHNSLTEMSMFVHIHNIHWRFYHHLHHLGTTIEKELWMDNKCIGMLSAGLVYELGEYTFKINFKWLKV
jgi:hypothetical protein